MATDNEVIHQCLEAVANSHTDIAPAVYASISEKMPGMDKHIGFMDSRMRGKGSDDIDGHCWRGSGVGRISSLLVRAC